MKLIDWIALFVAVLTLIAAWLVVPEFRTFLKLEEVSSIDDVAVTSESKTDLRLEEISGADDVAVISESKTDTKACPLAIGSEVQSKERANLWIEPNVMKSSYSSLSRNTTLEILEKPVLRQVRKDNESCLGWWYKVEKTSTGESGWIWDRRIKTCDDPENFSC